MQGVNGLAFTMNAGTFKCNNFGISDMNKKLRQYKSIAITFDYTWKVNVIGNLKHTLVFNQVC